MQYIESIKSYFWDIGSQFLLIGVGAVVTLQILFSAASVGILLGTLLAVMRHKNICIRSISAVISVIRGTPVILQLSFVYFAIPSFLGIKMSVVLAGILTFGFNSAAYVAEILRAGIEYLPKGQFEAAQTLRIPNFYMWRDIILPQVIRNIFPSMINEIITLLKETAIIGTIGAMDIMRRSQAIAAEQFTFFTPLLIAGAYYYIFVLIIEHIGKQIEKKLSY